MHHIRLLETDHILWNAITAIGDLLFGNVVDSMYHAVAFRDSEVHKCFFGVDLFAGVVRLTTLRVVLVTWMVVLSVYAVVSRHCWVHLSFCAVVKCLLRGS